MNRVPSTTPSTLLWWCQKIQYSGLWASKIAWSHWAVREWSYILKNLSLTDSGQSWDTITLGLWCFANSMSCRKNLYSSSSSLHQSTHSVLRCLSIESAHRIDMIQSTKEASQSEWGDFRNDGSSWFQKLILCFVPSIFLRCHECSFLNQKSHTCIDESQSYSSRISEYTSSFPCTSQMKSFWGFCQIFCILYIQ